MPLKICSCGHAHFELPKDTKELDGLIYFECHCCNSTLTIRKKVYLAYLLGNCYPPEEEAERPQSRSDDGGEFLGWVKKNCS